MEADISHAGEISMSGLKEEIRLGTGKCNRVLWLCASPGIGSLHLHGEYSRPQREDASGNAVVYSFEKHKVLFEKHRG